jgi:glycosyltransferase involved in cell wall biosynthesis
MACVTTPLGAGGLDVQDGGELLVAESPESLAARLVQVLSDESLARRLGNAARAYVRDHHSWSAVALRYERLLAQVRNSRIGIAT